MHPAIAQPCPRTPWTDKDATLPGAQQKADDFLCEGSGRARTRKRRAGARSSSGQSTRCAALAPVLGCPRRSCPGKCALDGCVVCCHRSWQLRMRRVLNGFVVAAYWREAFDDLCMMSRVCMRGDVALRSRWVRDCCCAEQCRPRVKWLICAWHISGPV